MKAQNFAERGHTLGNVSPTEPDNSTTDHLVQEGPQGQTIIYNQDSMGETIDPQALHEFTPDDSTLILLDQADAERFRADWDQIQGQFVDEPRQAVAHADALVGEVIGKISELFASQHDALENQWIQGGNISTEDLRQTLQHYRAFFNRLLTQVPV